MNKKINENKTETITFIPFSDKQIEKYSVGEITEVATCLEITGIDLESYQRKRKIDEANTSGFNIFSSAIFGSSEDNSRNLPKKFNFAHIDLKFPVVMPDKYALDNRNVLANLLCLKCPKAGELLKSIIQYESCILIPKANCNPFEHDSKINAVVEVITSTENAERFQENSGVINFPNLIKAEPINVETTKLHLGFEILNQTKNKNILSTESKFTDNYYVLRGAYAVSFLLGLIDIPFYTENLDYLSRVFPPIETGVTKSTDKIRNQIDFIKNTFSDGEASILDLIVTKVPVIPATFREPTKVELNNTTMLDLLSINLMYNEILKIKADARTSIDYKMIYGATREFMAKLFSEDISDINTYNQILFNLFSELNLEESSISNLVRRRKRIQEMLANEFISNNEGKDTMLGKLGSKYGILRDKSSSKRIDRTFRAVIIVNPELKLDYVGVPLSAVLKWYKDEIYSVAKKEGNLLSHLNDDQKSDSDRLYKYIIHLTTSNVNNMVTTGKRGTVQFTPVSDNKDQTLLSFVNQRLNKILKNKRILIIRYPSLHKYNELGFKIKVVTGNAVHFHPLVVTSYNADFDGDQVSAFNLETELAVMDVDKKLLPTRNLTNAKGQPLMSPSQEAVLGLYYLTKARSSKPKDTKPKYYPSFEDMFNAFQNKQLKVYDEVIVNYPHYTNSIFEKRYKRNRSLQTNINRNFDTEDLQYTKPEYEVNTQTNEFSLNTKNTARTSNAKLETIYETPNQTNLSKNIKSTVGRFIFNSIIPQDLGFVDREQDPYCLEVGDKFFQDRNITGLSNKDISSILKEVVLNIKDLKKVAYILDKFKEIGYTYATLSGFSLGLDDLNPSPEKDIIIDEYQSKIDEIKNNQNLSQEEKDKRSIELWMECTDEVTKVSRKQMSETNPLHMMIESGSRGNASQVQQLIGMRGIMNDAQGNAIVNPIKNNFVNGINATESVSASYGASKGSIDKGNSTKDTGELTRKLIFGLNDQTIKSGDCGDTEGFLLRQAPKYVIGERDSVGNLYLEDKDSMMLNPVFMYGQTIKSTFNGLDIPILDIYGNIYAPDIKYQGIPIYNIKYNRVLAKDLWDRFNFHPLIYGTGIYTGDDEDKTSPTIWIKEVSENEIQFVIYHSVREHEISFSILIDEHRNHYISKIVLKQNSNEEIVLFDHSITTPQQPIIEDYEIQVTLTDIITDGENIISPTDPNLTLTHKPTGEIKYKYKKPTGEILHAEVNIYDIIDDLQGRYIASDLIDPVTKEVLISRNKMINNKSISRVKLQKILNDYPEGIYLRSPITCKVKTCCKCHGYNLSTNSPAKVGDCIGLTAAHTVGELISQATLRTFHTGGAASAGDIGNVFKTIQNLLINGRVNSKILNRMTHIDNDDILIEKETNYVHNVLPKVYTHPNNKKDRFTMNLPTGQELEPVVKSSELEPSKTTYTTSVEYPTTLSIFGVTKYYVYVNSALSTLENIKEIFTSGGNNIPSIYFEIIVNKMFSEFEVLSSGESMFMIRSKITIDELIKTNTELLKRNIEPTGLVLVTPVFSTLRQMASPSTNPLQSILYGHLKTGVANATTNRLTSNLSSDTITSVLTGSKFPAGDEVVKRITEQINETFNIQTKTDFKEMVDLKYDKELEDIRKYIKEVQNSKSKTTAQIETITFSQDVTDDLTNLDFLSNTSTTTTNTEEQTQQVQNNDIQDDLLNLSFIQDGDDLPFDLDELTNNNDNEDDNLPYDLADENTEDDSNNIDSINFNTLGFN